MFDIYLYGIDRFKFFLMSVLDGLVSNNIASWTLIPLCIIPCRRTERTSAKVLVLKSCPWLCWPQETFILFATLSQSTSSESRYLSKAFIVVSYRQCIFYPAVIGNTSREGGNWPCIMVNNGNEINDLQ